MPLCHFRPRIKPCGESMEPCTKVRGQACPEAICAPPWKHTFAARKSVKFRSADRTRHFFGYLRQGLGRPGETALTCGIPSPSNATSASFATTASPNRDERTRRKRGRERREPIWRCVSYGEILGRKENGSQPPFRRWVGVQSVNMAITRRFAGIKMWAARSPCIRRSPSPSCNVTVKTV